MHTTKESNKWLKDTTQQLTKTQLYDLVEIKIISLNEIYQASDIHSVVGVSDQEPIKNFLGDAITALSDLLHHLDRENEGNNE